MHTVVDTSYYVCVFKCKADSHMYPDIWMCILYRYKYSKIKIHLCFSISDVSLSMVLYILVLSFML